MMKKIAEKVRNLMKTREKEHFFLKKDGFIFHDFSCYFRN